MSITLLQGRHTNNRFPFNQILRSETYRMTVMQVLNIKHFSHILHQHGLSLFIRTF